MNNEYTTLEWWCPVNKETIGQYIGEEDSKGREIYEGDILKTNINGEECIAKVMFEHGSFLLWDKEGNYHVIRNWNKYEVIGNIFDNTDKIKRK